MASSCSISWALNRSISPMTRPPGTDSSMITTLSGAALRRLTSSAG